MTVLANDLMEAFTICFGQPGAQMRRRRPYLLGIDCSENLLAFVRTTIATAHCLAFPFQKLICTDAAIQEIPSRKNVIDFREFITERVW